MADVAGESEHVGAGAGNVKGPEAAMQRVVVGTMPEAPGVVVADLHADARPSLESTPCLHRHQHGRHDVQAGQ